MTDRLCPHCGAALAPGAVLCDAGRTNLRQDLESVPQALTELDLALSRQTAMPPSHGAGGCPDGCGHGDDDPRCVAGVRLDLDERASTARLALVTCLHGWVRVLDEQHPVPPATDSVGPACATCRHPSCQELRHDARRLRDRLLSSAEGQATLLWSWLPLVGSPAWLPDLARELRDALGEAWAAVERPPDSVVAGACRTCRRALYALDGVARAYCPWCGTTQDVAETRADAIAEAEHARAELLPKPEISRLLGVPVGTLHRWSSEHRILRHGVNGIGQPLYALGRIADAVRRGTPPERIPSVSLTITIPAAEHERFGPGIAQSMVAGGTFALVLPDGTHHEALVDKAEVSEDGRLVHVRITPLGGETT